MKPEWQATIIIAVMLAVTLLARRLRVADPILLVIAGAALALAPGMPEVVVDPELLLLVVLPPLLFWHAFIVSPREIRANAPAIALFAVVLVAVTAAAAAAVLHLLADVPWAVAIAIGAVVAPTDPIAFLTVARRLGVSPRLVGLLDGENLLNDFTALVIYGVAIEAATTHSMSAPEAVLRFFVIALAGVAIGLVVGCIVSWLNTRMSNPLIPPVVTLGGAYLAFLPAEALLVSAVLATGVAGRIAGSRSAFVDLPATRVVGYGFWNTWTFLLTAVLFVLVGLHLPVALARVPAASNAVLVCAAVILAVVVVRLLFVSGVGLVIAPIATCITISGKRWPWADTLVVGWSGMRGAMSLIMALILPIGFPFRDLAIIVTFAVIFVTLVGQGLTLPLLIRKLPIERDTVTRREAEQVRETARRAALAELDKVAGGGRISGWQEQRLRAGYECRADATADEAREVELQMIQAERTAAIAMRQAGTISDDVLREIESELDMRVLLLTNEQERVEQ